MKLKLAIATTILVVSTSAVQADDTRTPDILGSVSTGSVQTLSKTDAFKTRGEYRSCSNGSYICGYWTPVKPKTLSGRYIQAQIFAGVFVVSR